MEHTRETARWLMVILSLGLALEASAGNQLSVADDYPARLRASSTVQSLSAEDAFGDKLGLYTGSLEFLQTDLVLPGGPGLDIDVSRKLTVGSQGGTRFFSDWDLAIPSVHGVFSEQGGWNSGLDGRNLNRCSKYAWPAVEIVQGESPSWPRPERQVMPEDFWYGTFLYLPGVGEEEILKVQENARLRPSNGGTYPLTTKSGAAIRCIAINGGAEEGFEVLTPAGITYQFAFMVKRFELPIVTYGPQPGGNSNLTPTRFVLQRADHRLFPVTARDRFGNALNYEWDAPSGQLRRISSTDGRSVEFSYNGTRISQVRAAGRTWAYDYAAGVLTTVILPDNSHWSFTPGLTMSFEAAGNVPALRAFCNNPGVPSYSSVASMQHPSGAIATFTITPTLHGRSYEYYSCSAQPNTALIRETMETFPARYYAWSLTRKVVSGPGLPAPYEWTYDYGSHNGCYVSGLAASDPMTCKPNAPMEKQVVVVEPSGATVRHVFSNKADHSEGYPLRVERPGSVQTTSYEFGDPGQFPLYAGISIMPAAGRGWYLSRINPLRERSILQDGVKSSWRVNAFDTMARPTSITESSSILP